MQVWVLALCLGVVGALPAFRGNWRARKPTLQKKNSDDGNTAQLVNREQLVKMLNKALVERQKRGADCADTGADADCSWWNEQGYCTDDKYKEAMVEQCAATCGCEKQVEQKATEEQLEELQATLEKRETHNVVERECENKGSAEDCAWWKEEGYCSNDEFKDAMLEQCPCECDAEELEMNAAVAVEKRDSEGETSM